MKFAVIDFETTGLGVKDRIIQVGIVQVEEGNITHRYQSLVQPGVEIPPFITNLTGIDQAMLEHAPSLDEVMAQVLPLISEGALVAHNASFDVGFLSRALDECGYSPFSGQVIDTIDLLRMLYPGMASLDLSMAADYFGIRHEGAHRAAHDAEVTAELLIRCLDKLESLPLLTLQRLCHVFDQPGFALAEDMGWFLAYVLAEKQLRISEDLNAGRYYRQFALAVEDWSKEKPPRDEVDVDALEPDFEQFYESLKEKLRITFQQFELREAQDQMINEVQRALVGHKHLLIEAGTGTGKSLGYLIPSLHYSILHDEKVTISTHTINLQEQLRQRDVPLLQQIFPVPFKVAVLKGRSHYLCLRKFEHKMNERDFDAAKEEMVAAAQMIVWLGETEIGDEEELHFGHRGSEFWSTVASDSDSCLNRECPWFHKCFYHRAKHQSNLADVVITNHSMLFTDTQAEHRLLPAYDKLVIDEAHHLVEVAGKHLGRQVSYMSMAHLLQWLARDAASGQLPALKLALSGDGHEDSTVWCETIEELLPNIHTIKQIWDDFCEKMYNFGAGSSGGTGGELSNTQRFRKSELPAGWNTVIPLEDNLYVALGVVLKTLEKLLNDVKEKNDEESLQGLLTDLSGTVKDLFRQRDDLRSFMKMDDENTVYWLETNPTYRTKSLQMIAVPIDVSPMLQTYFFDKNESVVLTSATLSVNRAFDYMSKQLGLDAYEADGKLETVQLPSPFDYRNNVLVCIPRDFPKLKGASEEDEFIGQLVRSIADTAAITNGRMLVLFTSYRMLKQVHELLKDRLGAMGIGLLGQGVDSGNRSKLTRWFRDSDACVLLGTSSFWEGVDIPGDALTCLAIVRLPFQPPNHPLVEAKCELIKNQNKNPFMEYSLPQAVIRFKQGFGRLIRSAQDQGIVIIYDTRVIDTFYGKKFLYSLPGPKIEHMVTGKMIPRVREWLISKQKTGEGNELEVDENI